MTIIVIVYTNTIKYMINRFQRFVTYRSNLHPLIFKSRASPGHLRGWRAGEGLDGRRTGSNDTVDGSEIGRKHQLIGR